MKKNKFLNSYTLAEVVVVMLVIAVIVSVTIRVTKAKLDSVISYTYYAAYSTLRTVTQSLVADFDPDDSDYMSFKGNLNLAYFPRHKVDFFNNYFIPPAKAECGSDVNMNCAENEVWSEDNCACVDTPRTLPRKGAKFCKLFEQRINTNTSSCSGSSISDSVSDFSSKTPDIVLRNGIRIYNLHQDPTNIAVLQNNENTGSYTGVDNTNTWGYTVYVDVDGANSGDSVKWEDVYPFYITLSGRVIPAYDSSNPGEYGGDSPYHLQVSIYNEKVNSSGSIDPSWIEKSITFKEGACKVGYISSTTPYCGGISKLAECSAVNSACQLKAIRPVKFF